MLAICMSSLPENIAYPTYVLTFLHLIKENKEI